MIFAAQIAHVGHVVNHAIHIRLVILAEEAGKEVHAHKTACTEELAQLIIGEVAGVIAQGAHAAVGSHGRRDAIQKVIEARFVQMAHIHRHMALTHAFDDRPAERGILQQTRVS